MLASYLNSFAHKVIGRTPGTEQPWAFHSHLHRVEDSNQALQLPDVVLKVFSFLDSTVLCSTVPLVCKQWRATAVDPQLWTARLPQQVLAVAANHVAAASLQAGGIGKDIARHGARTSSSCNMPLLHQALYSRNLLRNPNFLQSHNSDYLRLIRMRPGNRVSFPGSRDAGRASVTAQSVISTEQRRLAWVNVTYEPGDVTWQSPPIGINPTHSPPQPPKPYPNYNNTSSSSTLSQHLQGWLRGLTSSAVSATAAAVALVNDQAIMPQQPEQPGVMSCLATGSNWGEVVQVVDLLEELTMRGLPAPLAAALLDSGTLALGLSIWAAAPDQCSGRTTDLDSPSSSSSSNNSSTESHSDSDAMLQVASEAQSAALRVAMTVALMLDDGQMPLRSFNTFVRRESSHHFVSKRVPVSPGGWKRYTYLLHSCPPGCRRAVVLLRGRGPLSQSQHIQLPWQQQQQQQSNVSSGSSSGVRFTGAELSFVKQRDADSWQCGSVALI